MQTFFKKYWDFILLSVFVLAYAVIFSYLSIARHNAFASGYDLGNMDSTVWNTINGNIFQFSEGGNLVSRFSIHADLILVLLSPLYLIWENVRVLLISQSVLLALGAIPVYLIARAIVKDKLISFAIVFLYLLNPGMQWTNIYDFHGVSFAIPFLLFSFYFAYIKKWRWFWLFIVLALLTKEQISLSVAMLGLVIAVVFKERKVGLQTFLLGCVWFLVMVFVVIPYFNSEGKHWALSWYQLGSAQDGTSSSATSTPITMVQAVFHKFFLAADVIPYYKSLLSPFAFLPILGIPWLILALPEITVNMLSSHGQMRSIVFHYDSGVTPWLVVSAIFGVYYVRKLFERVAITKKYARIFTYGLVMVSLLFAVRYNYHYSPLPTTPSCWCFMYEPTKEDMEFEALLKQIPEDASISASPEIWPHITHRQQVHTVPTATDSADFIALIDQNRIVGNYEPKEFELQLRDSLNAGDDYKLVEHVGHFYLYKRNEEVR